LAYSEDKWDKCQADYEVHGLSFDKLTKKHGIGRATITNRAKKYSWVKSLVGQLVNAELASSKDIAELKRKQDEVEHYKEDIKEKLETKLAVQLMKDTNDLRTVQNQALLISQQGDMIQNFDKNDERAHFNHKSLVDSNKSLDNSASSGTTINNQTTSNTQINITIEESKENLESLLGSYD